MNASTISSETITLAAESILVGDLMDRGMDQLRTLCAALSGNAFDTHDIVNYSAVLDSAIRTLEPVRDRLQGVDRHHATVAPAAASKARRSAAAPVLGDFAGFTLVDFEATFEGLTHLANAVCHMLGQDRLGDGQTWTRAGSFIEHLGEWLDGERDRLIKHLGASPDLFTTQDDRERQAMLVVGFEAEMKEMRPESLARLAALIGGPRS